MQHRRSFKQTQSLEARLAEEAKRLREEAKLLPPGALREELIRKARRAETASHINEWLTSSGLRPPEWSPRLSRLQQTALRRRDPRALGSLSIQSPRVVIWLITLAQQLAGFSIDEMDPSAGRTGDRLVLVFGNIWIVIQLVLDVEPVAGHLKMKWPICQNLMSLRRHTMI